MYQVYSETTLTALIPTRIIAKGNEETQKEISDMISDAFRTINPFRTAVPFWGQTIQISSSLSPKRDWGPKGVKMPTAAKYLRTPRSPRVRSFSVRDVAVTWYLVCFTRFVLLAGFVFLAAADCRHTFIL